MSETEPPATPPRRRKARPLSRVLLFAAVLVLSLGAVEVALRVVGFRYVLYPEDVVFGYPEPEKIEKGYFHEHPRYLFVARTYAGRLEAARATPPDVVMLGCSCTEWGAFDVALGKLAERAGKPVEIANLACSGWSSFSGRNVLEDDVLALRPRIVTIYFGWNDHWFGSGLEDKAVADLNARPWKRTLQGSRLVQWITKAVVEQKTSGARTLGEGSRPRRVSLGDFEANLVTMVEMCREHDIVPVLMTAPDAHVEGEEPAYLEGQYLQDVRELVPLHDAYVETVRRVAAEHDVVLCDLAAAFDALPRDELLLYMKDDGIHFEQEFGGPAVARLLLRTLVEHDLL